MLLCNHIMRKFNDACSGVYLLKTFNWNLMEVNPFRGRMLLFNHVKKMENQSGRKTRMDASAKASCHRMQRRLLTRAFFPSRVICNLVARHTRKKAYGNRAMQLDMRKHITRHFVRFYTPLL